MRCAEATEILWSAAEEPGAELPPRLSVHLASCAACRATAEEIAQVWRLLGDFPEVEPGPDFKAEFYRRLRASPAGEVRPPGRQPVPGWHWLAAAATALVILVIAGSRLTLPPPEIAGSATGWQDRWDDGFLEELERTLVNLDAEYLSAYDSWPGLAAESPATEPKSSAPARESQSKGEIRNEGA
ncbi:MAG: hypothetical protein ABIG68_08145 [Acidobacteriota bacterium]